MSQGRNCFVTKRASGLLVLLMVVSSVVWAQQKAPGAPPNLGYRHDIDPHLDFVNFHEDWNALGLSTSNLQPQTPVLGEKYDIPGKNFIRQRFQLYWRPGDPLDLYVILPRDVKNPAVVLYLYSFPQETERFKNDTWCMSATGGGRYAAVGFVSALTGHRSEYRPPKEWFVSEFQESLATSVHDVQMILNYLAKRGDLDMNRVGMFGQGSGASIAIMASAVDPRIKAVDALGPWGDWPDWIAKTSVVPDTDRSKYSTQEFLAHVAQLDPIIWLPKMKAKSFRLQDVRKDPAVPDVAEEKMEAVAPEFAEINQFADDSALFPMASGGKLFGWLGDKLDPGGSSIEASQKTERIRFYPSRMRKGDESPLPMGAKKD